MKVQCQQTDAQSAQRESDITILKAKIANLKKVNDAKSANNKALANETEQRKISTKPFKEAADESQAQLTTLREEKASCKSAIDRERSVTVDHQRNLEESREK